jgi:hypothetical protein
MTLLDFEVHVHSDKACIRSYQQLTFVPNMPSDKPQVTIFKLTSSHIPSIYPMFHFEANAQPNRSKTETLIDLISSRQHLSEVFKSVFLSYSRNGDLFGGYMTLKLFCVLLGVYYIAWTFFFWILTFL